MAAAAAPMVAVAVAAADVNVSDSEDSMPIQRALSGVITCSVLAIAGMASAADTVHAVQRRFATPDAAVSALVGADRDNNATALLSILGTSGARLIRSGDPVADRIGRERFVAAFDEAHRIELEGANKAVLILGKAEWPLPIPLVHGAAGWRFDTEAGAQEILDRRIGNDELRVIEVCRAYVAAQREYGSLPANGQNGFARRFVSTRDQHDGLYWPAQPGEPPSPLGPLVAQAQASGYGSGEAESARSASQPYYGYYFRILTAQGPSAPGGARSYLVDGKMTDGFALLAYPAIHGTSGVMSFIVNEHGIVFERNLGPRTTQIAQAITAYDPDADWHIVAP